MRSVFYHHKSSNFCYLLYLHRHSSDCRFEAPDITQLSRRLIIRRLTEARDCATTKDP